MLFRRRSPPIPRNVTDDAPRGTKQSQQHSNKQSFVMLPASGRASVSFLFWKENGRKTFPNTLDFPRAQASRREFLRKVRGVFAFLGGGIRNGTNKSPIGCPFIQGKMGFRYKAVQNMCKCIYCSNSVQWNYLALNIYQIKNTIFSEIINV